MNRLSQNLHIMFRQMSTCDKTIVIVKRALDYVNFVQMSLFVQTLLSDY